MRQNNQEHHYNMKVAKTSNQKNNYTTSIQSNTYQNQNNLQNLSQKGTSYVSRRANQPSEVNKTNISLSNKAETQLGKYSNISQQGNQRYNIQQRVLNQYIQIKERQVMMDTG